MVNFRHAVNLVNVWNNFNNKVSAQYLHPPPPLDLVATRLSYERVPIRKHYTQSQLIFPILFSPKVHPVITIWRYSTSQKLLDFHSSLNPLHVYIKNEQILLEVPSFAFLNHSHPLKQRQKVFIIVTTLQVICKHTDVRYTNPECRMLTYAKIANGHPLVRNRYRFHFSSKI